MKKQKSRTILSHLLEDILDIERFLQDVSKEEFLANSMVKKAVCMSLLNIGEMSRELPEAITRKNPDIPWSSIVALRNRVAHGYHSLDDEVIWDIAKHDLDEFKGVILYELQLLEYTIFSRDTESIS